MVGLLLTMETCGQREVCRGGSSSAKQNLQILGAKLLLTLRFRNRFVSSAYHARGFVGLLEFTDLLMSAQVRIVFKMDMCTRFL